MINAKREIRTMNGISKRLSRRWPGPLNNFRFGVTVKAALFDGRQTSTRVAVAKINQKQADT